MVLGSGRRLLDEPELLRTYRPAPAERPPLLLANLGALQTSGRGGADRAEQVVSILDADGLSIHLNPLQEAIQPEGEPHFGRALDGIAEAVERLRPLPVWSRRSAAARCGRTPGIAASIPGALLRA